MTRTESDSYNERWKPGFKNFAIGVGESVAATLATAYHYAQEAKNAAALSLQIFAPGGVIDPNAMNSDALSNALTAERQATSMSSFFQPSIDHLPTTFLQIAAPLYVAFAETANTSSDPYEHRLIRTIRKIHFQLAMMTTSLAVPVLSEWINRLSQDIFHGIPAHATITEGFIVAHGLGSIFWAKYRYKKDAPPKTSTTSHGSKRPIHSAWAADGIYDESTINRSPTFERKPLTPEGARAERGLTIYERFNPNYKPQWQPDYENLNEAKAHPISVERYVHDAIRQADKAYEYNLKHLPYGYGYDDLSKAPAHIQAEINDIALEAGQAALEKAADDIKPEWFGHQPHSYGADAPRAWEAVQELQNKASILEYQFLGDAMKNMSPENRYGATNALEQAGATTEDLAPSRRINRPSDLGPPAPPPKPDPGSATAGKFKNR